MSSVVLRSRVDATISEGCAVRSAEPRSIDDQDEWPIAQNSFGILCKDKDRAGIDHTVGKVDGAREGGGDAPVEDWPDDDDPPPRPLDHAELDRRLAKLWA